MTVSSKRAEYMSAVSLVLSVIFFAISWFLGNWSDFFAVSAVSWQILGAGLIWLVLLLQFHQRSLAEQEKLDMSQLGRSKDSSTIFQGKSEHESLFAVAQGRLKLFEKWFLPVFSGLIAVYQLGMGFYLFRGAGVEGLTPRQPLVCAVGMTAIAFVSFLLSRYAVGMSASRSVPAWKPLRAGGSFMLGSAIVCFLLAIGLAMAHFNYPVGMKVMGYVVPVLLLVLGLETALNVLLDIYRPRLKGQYSRSAFDSRLLGIISEPGEVFHTAAGAIDYQFGFKVSQTWFYKLLAKAVAPLVLFAVLTLYLLSSVVIVAPNEEAIIEHFGKPVNDANDVRIAGPGLTFKWPWPVDIAYKYPTKKVMELSIGYVPKTDPETGEEIYEARLWGKAHYAEEYNLLVASEQELERVSDETVPVSLIMAAVPVQYRVKDLYSFTYNHDEPEKVLEAICYRQLTRFAASAKIEVDEEDYGGDGSKQSILGAGRAYAKKVLTERIQKAADEAGLGLEVVFLGLQGLHPPPEVAPDYQKVVGAVQKKQASILDANAESNKVLSTLAGSVPEANELYSLAASYQKAREANNTEEMETLGEQLDRAFERAKGDIFTALRQSQSYAFEKSTLARATGERFASQLKAYNSGPEIYKREQRLLAFEEVLQKIRKYVIVADTEDTQVFIVDVQEKVAPSLYELGGLEEYGEK